MRYETPVIFNCLKHHLGYIHNSILYFSNHYNNLEGLSDELLNIGRSRIDLYTGKISHEEIIDFIVARLKCKKRFNKTNFKKWLGKNGEGYQTMILPDRSSWIFKWGKNEEKYIHIHPARNSINCISVNASTLKTAIACMVYIEIHGGSPYESKLINRVRKNILGASPIKKVRRKEGIGNLIRLLNQIPD